MYCTTRYIEVDKKENVKNVNLDYEAFLQTFELEVSFPSYKCYLKPSSIHHTGQGIFQKHSISYAKKSNTLLH